MTINQFPLDPAGLPARFLEASAAEFDGKQSERDGIPVWNVSLLVQVPDQRPETLIVKVAAKTCPRLAELAEVRQVHPVISYWNQHGRSGVSVRADSIEELHPTPAKPTAPQAS
jgi:hypothetical protein